MISLVVFPISFIVLCYYDRYWKVNVAAQAISLRQSFAFTETSKQYVVNLHNNFRSQIAGGTLTGQPSAANMIQLVWNERLGAKAKAWSERCNFTHSDGTKTPGYFWVGENLAVGVLNKNGIIYPKNETDWNAIVATGFEMWSEEYRWFHFPKTCIKEPCGHYTQLAWAKTQKVGCGISVCKGMHSWNVGENLAYLLVCNYGPGGNYVDENPYEIGEACGSCPKEASTCQSNKLCINIHRLHCKTDCRKLLEIKK